MYGISGEHLLVLAIILLIFGPRRLPDLGHSIGRTLKNFKDGMSGQGAPAPAAESPKAAAPLLEKTTVAKTEATEVKQEAEQVERV